MPDKGNPAGVVALRLGVKLDPDDLRIISALYFGGVCHAAGVRAFVGLSRMTFYLRVRRLKRARIVVGGPDAIDADLHNLNLILSVRRKLFALETEIRSAGVFGGSLLGDGTGQAGCQLSSLVKQGPLQSQMRAREMGRTWVG